jgi:hypothetical protein
MNVRRPVLTIVTAVLLWSTACEPHRSTTPCRHAAELPARNGAKLSISQGIWGDVWFWAGNFQPICISGTVTPVSREVLVHALTPYDSVVVADLGPTFYSEVHTPLIATAWSDSSGFFQVELAPGTYSIFVREDSLYYANGFDGQSNVWPVVVAADSVSGIRFDINYASAW